MKFHSIAAIAVVNVTVAHAGVIFSFTGTGTHEQFSGGATAITDPFPIQLNVTLPDFPIAISNPYAIPCTGMGGCPAGAGLTWLRGLGNNSDVMFFSIAGSGTGFYAFQFSTGTFTSFGGPVTTVLGDTGAVTITATPEPQTCFMLALGIVSLYFARPKQTPDRLQTHHRLASPQAGSF